MRSESDESCRLFSLVTPQNLLHRTLQVVITKGFENSHEIGKPQFVCFQKRLLAAVELHFTTGMDLVCYQGCPVNWCKCRCTNPMKKDVK
jgi:hypothetical protein